MRVVSNRIQAVEGTSSSRVQLGDPGQQPLFATARLGVCPSLQSMDAPARICTFKL